MGLLFEGKYRKAIQNARQSVIVDPNYAYGFATLGWVLQFAGQSEDALRALGAETHSLPAEDTVSRYPSARVLIAEDNEVLRMVAFGLLERHGIVPTFAEDGAEAVLLTTQQPFDLIFMDVHMPRMDGFEATALIKRQHGDSIPIIAMTADVLPETATRLQQAGVVGSVPKPVVPELLAEALARHLPHLAQTRATPSPDTGDIRSAG